VSSVLAIPAHRVERKPAALTSGERFSIKNDTGEH